ALKIAPKAPPAQAATPIVAKPAKPATTVAAKPVAAPAAAKPAGVKPTAPPAAPTPASKPDAGSSMRVRASDFTSAQPPPAPSQAQPAAPAKPFHVGKGVEIKETGIHLEAEHAAAAK